MAGLPPKDLGEFSPLNPPPPSVVAARPPLNPLSDSPASGSQLATPVRSSSPSTGATAPSRLAHHHRPPMAPVSARSHSHVGTPASDAPVVAEDDVHVSTSQVWPNHTPPVPPPSEPAKEPETKQSQSASDKQGNAAEGSRLLVVSNRLPVTIKRDPRAEGGYTFHPSSGGLVSALAGVKKTTPFIWFGWPGISVPKKDREFIEHKLSTVYSCEPIWLPNDVADGHYNGFSNSVLWPLYHYRPGEMNFDEASWLAYRQANLMFAQGVRAVAQPGDMVWVQDYHLSILPLLLRTLVEGTSQQDRTSQLELELIRKGLKNKLDLDLPDGQSTLFVPRRSTDAELDALATEAGSILPRGSIKIGFFLHTPFPSSEIYRILPVRREILLGILHSDLIGFHTYDYARHFLASCTRILSMKVNPNGLPFEGRYVHVGAYPIGIEPQSFYSALKTPEVTGRMDQLLSHFQGKKIIIGVDRLDYIKGVPQKMLGFETFLKQHPDWAENCVLIQVAVPSRQDVEEYQALRCLVNEMVGRINSEFGSAIHVPIHFLHRSVPFNELVALYAVSDACLVTSTRDGMNLVSYEYIACQAERKGVMILSEFAGVAQSFNGSLIINPWDKQAVADAIHEALTMPMEQRSKNVDQLRGFVDRHTSLWWGNSFVRDMARIRVSKHSDSPPGQRQSLPRLG